jgi:hypothetical protein
VTLCLPWGQREWIALSAVNINAINVNFSHLENLKRPCEAPDLVLEGEDHGVVGILDILRELASSHRPGRVSICLDGEVQDH